MQIVGQYGSAEAALDRVTADSPDVILTDLGLPGMSGSEFCGALQQLVPRTPVLILTVFGEDRHVFEALCMGACGYLLKDTEPASLLEAIREIYDNGAPMSPEIARRVVQMFRKFSPVRSTASKLSSRESEVLQLLADGHSYKSCAERLSVSQDTVRFHVRNIYECLHVHSKSEAVTKAFREGLIH
jgi:DNA-binding NarL/FixJ family response regulator